jgi:hypothetical protein
MLWASLLNVWSRVLGSRSRERGGRTRLQKRDNQHNLLTTSCYTYALVRVGFGRC